MFDILHRVQVNAPAKKTYDALTTREGLAAWWTNDTKGNSGNVDGMIQFRFGERGGFDMRVSALEPGKHVAWQVVSGPEEWIGTKLSFDLASVSAVWVVLRNVRELFLRGAMFGQRGGSAADQRVRVITAAHAPRPTVEPRRCGKSATGKGAASRHHSNSARGRLGERSP